MLKYHLIRDRLLYNQNCIIPRLQGIGEDKLAQDIGQCGQVSCIATCKACGAKYFAGTNHCKSRYCAVCAKLRSMAWLCKLVPVLEDYRKRGYKLFMLNLTIKDNESLTYILNKLMLSWRVMTHDYKTARKQFRALNNGGIRSIEIKLGENSGQWHPHIHSIVILKSDKEVHQYNAYRKLWEHSTGLACGTCDKVGSVDIRGLKGYDGDIIKAVVETFKYITKFDWLKMADEQLVEMIHLTKGRRFISAWGELYGINKQVEELLEGMDEQQLREHTCKVCGCTEFELDSLYTNTLPPELLDFDN